MQKNNSLNTTPSLGELLSYVNILRKTHDLSDEQFLTLLTTDEEEVRQHLFTEADSVRRENYGTDVYVRGLIEFSNYCKNDCYYCGIRHGNKNATRYRLSEEEILDCCKEGYELGFRTFVLQSGEDPYFTDERLISIIKHIHNHYPDCAITLSIGEKEHDSYQAYFD
nr:[FeFe] hydrogenase H-cluster radical SAM maturase HydE [Lachnospiraceae bacterium]